MEEKYKPQEDLVAIRDMMERSSKFLSLSGLSGIFAGCCAILGAAYAFFFLLGTDGSSYGDYMQNLNNQGTFTLKLKLIVTALIILVVALGGAVYFSARKAKRKKLQVWNRTTKQLLQHLFIPLIAGGLFSLLLILQNNSQWVAPVTLIFYGLALVNAGKYTFGEIHYLGLSEIAMGLLAGAILNYGLLFWTLGFGLLHIIYGIVMYFKYER